MELQYVYTKLRHEFGKQCLFSDRGPELIDNYSTQPELIRNYIRRNPVNASVQCSNLQAEHEINTLKTKFCNGAINHTEGGWPKEINFNDEDQPKRYRRKIEKDDRYQNVVFHLASDIEQFVLQNNSVNIYEHYFEDLELVPEVKGNSARMVNSYEDQCAIKRPVTHISWEPDSGKKLAITYCNMDFQHSQKHSPNSYIWDVENPNNPIQILKPPAPLVCLEYHSKDPNCLVAGMLNGLISVWDIRRGSDPVELSIIEKSHRDPVRSVLWIQSKSGFEFFSGSSDGQCKWWDMRKMSEPTETLILDMVKMGEEPDRMRAQGVSCLEYDSQMPTRFMIGTEHGCVILGNKKGKLHHEKMVGKFDAHLGPVYALQRNPGFIKIFLTVGDWSARLWYEDCKENPLIWTKYHKYALTNGAWSPTRFSSFLTTRHEGTLDIWDILQDQKTPALSVKICDVPLRCIRIHEVGRLVTVGSQKGTTYLVQLSENLATVQKNDKAYLTQLFERETHREKIMEARMREIRLKMKEKERAPQKELVEQDENATDPERLVQDAQDEFFKIIDKETKPPEPPEPLLKEVEPEPEPELIIIKPEPTSSKKKSKKEKGGKKKKK